MSVMVSAPVKYPAEGGVNVMEMLQVACGARVPVQVFAEMAKFALGVIVEIFSGAWPLLSSMVVMGGLATPMAELPKSSSVFSSSASGNERPVP